MTKKISKIVVPNDHAYIEGVRAYSVVISRVVGFSDKECREIGSAITEACTNVIDHAFDPYEDENFTVTFEILGNGLLVIVSDMGLPFSTLPERKDKEAHGFRALEELMDEVLFINRGRLGKELKLYKYLKGSHVKDIFNAEELAPYTSCDLLPLETDYSLRLMVPEEAVQVSRCIYRAYRYTYLKEDLYFPERIAALNREGKMISAVAVNEAGEVVAHFALLPRPEGSRVAEIGVAVVVPRNRKRGLMKMLLEFLMKEAKERGFVALFGNAFTMHNLSQKTNLDFGFSETALQLGSLPPGSVKILTDCGLKGAGNIMTFFKYLEKTEEREIFPPTVYRDMIEKIYEKLSVERVISNPPKEDNEANNTEAIIHVDIHAPYKCAYLELKDYGPSMVERVKAKQTDLQTKGFNALYMDLNLNDRSTPRAASELMELGFFFCGLLPDFSGYDVLRLQQYNTDIRYDEINTSSEFAAELTEYIRSMDPKWKALHG